MLEQPALLLRPRDDDPPGRVWIVDPATGALLGSAGRRTGRDRLGWLPWRPRSPVEVREGDDEPLVFTLRRAWAPAPGWRVEDADGALVGRVRGPHLLDGHARRFAALVFVGPQQALYRDAQRLELARTESGPGGVRVAFLPPGEGNPFIKMMLLAAALVHNQAALGRL